MKRKLFAIILMVSVVMFSCKPKDTDIAADAQKTISANHPNAKVDVKDGVATISGEFKDEAAKKDATDAVAKVKGVKDVINNGTIPPPPPPPAPVMSATDQALNDGIKTVLKDFNTVSATVENGVINLTGELAKNRLPKLMMALNALKPTKIENHITVK